MKGALTDGCAGSPVKFRDGQWQGFLRGGSRSIVVDLGRVNTVNQIQESFFRDPDSGIYFPREVTYSLSSNNTEWADVGTVFPTIPLTSTRVGAQTYTLSGLNYQARYVRMTFPVDVWAFADQFKVFGKSGIVDDAKLPIIGPSKIDYPDSYCPPGSPKVGGTRNMVLICNGYDPSSPATAQNTVKELTPYVGYEDRAGVVKDFMFDSFLFLPLRDAPSGGRFYCDPSHPTVKSDWEYYLNNTFDSVYNLLALNKATGSVKRILGDPNYRAKVEIAIPYPTLTATNFGDINGRSVNLVYLAERDKAIRWYVDQVMNRWDSANYTNLELVGFYWDEEEADYEVDDSEEAMLRYTGGYVRSMGKVFNWIPFYQSSGFDEWDSLGFDEAEMQPNYSFNDWSVEELGEAASIVKKLGMGIEIEIHWDALTDSTLRAKYYSYLDYGVMEGYMTGAAHSYWQNAGPGTFYESCMSKDPALREVYDDTYKFIKGTYSRK